ncbi:MAG: GH32 C-terminal domain-containing protein, partial [Planctomycetes bacterium]|nr:GH32 C-terminal domain-containing protein [Planctomycetota bacterium]
RVDFFAPESVLTPDGRRVMWAWLASVDRNDGTMSRLTMQSLPRELEVPADGTLRIRPLRELEKQRRQPVVQENVVIKDVAADLPAQRSPVGTKLADLPGESVELRLTIPRAEADRKLFGLTLFADGKGGGLPLTIRPETGTLRLGTTEAPFAVADLPAGEDLVLRIFVDRFLVEVFVNDRQALLATYPESAGKLALHGFTIGAPTTIRRFEMWKVEPTNQGFLEAQTKRIWEPQTE